jgi:type II secretory pathway pseudopilin PulG
MERTASGTEHGEVTDAPPRSLVRLLVALVVVGLLLGVAGLVVPRAFADDGEDASRQDLVTAANDFATAYNTYDVAELEDYQRRMSGLLTEDYREQFDQVTEAIFGALTAKKQRSSDPEVLGVAIDAFDTDSAEVLVAVDASISNTDQKTAVRRHFRWKVTFLRQDDAWRVDDFESIAAMTAETGQPQTEQGAGQ